VPVLEPVWLGDKHFEKKDADIEDLTRFEATGTADVVRWNGLVAACDLYHQLTPEFIEERQNALVDYLRFRLDEKLKPEYHTPMETEPEYKTAILAFRFPKERLNVNDVSLELWNQHRIFVKNDMASEDPAVGLRVSCHYALNESDLDRFIEALSEFVEDA
jgi:selenocysteine lyase/cysteine desulfurase